MSTVAYVLVLLGFSALSLLSYISFINIIIVCDLFLIGTKKRVNSLVIPVSVI